MLESKRVGKVEENTKKEIHYQFNMKDATDNLRIDEDQFVVLKGSTAAAISGGTENGRKVWKLNGILLSEVEKSELSKK